MYLKCHPNDTGEDFLDKHVARPARASDHRRDIDGLRAIAVVPVILFHGGVEAMRGGYVGVDVFFVISGFVITTLVLRQIDDGRFEWRTFFTRRARRLLPALGIVLAASAMAAWTLLLPRELHEFAKSLLAAMAWSSNILFWQANDYFAPAAERAPLLHTWSLAVEAQFYLLLPTVLLLATRMTIRWRAFALIGIALGSLAHADITSVTDPRAAFFLVQSRAWELLAGAAAAAWVHERPRPQTSPGLVAHASAFAGLALIAFSLLNFTQGIPNPGPQFLIPVGGTVLILLFARPESGLGRLLALRPLAATGAASYSAYLWHQPVLAFLRQEDPARSVPATLALGLPLVALLTWLTWRYVEDPIRRGRLLSPRAFAMTAAGGLVTLAVGGLACLWTAGLPERYEPHERRLLSEADRDWRQALSAYDLGRCFIDYRQSYSTLVDMQCLKPRAQLPRVVIFGDSHAAHWLPGVRKEFDAAAFAVHQWTATSCRPIVLPGQIGRCADFQRHFVDDVLPTLAADDILIVSARWISIAQSHGLAALGSGLADLLGKASAAGVTTIVIGNTPEYQEWPQHAVVRRGLLGQDSAQLISRDFHATNETLARVTGKSGQVYFDPAARFCPEPRNLRCKVMQSGHMLYIDGGHLSSPGSELGLGGLRLLVTGHRQS